MTATLNHYVTHVQTRNQDDNAKVFSIYIWWNTVDHRLQCKEQTATLALSAV